MAAGKGMRKAVMAGVLCFAVLVAPMLTGCYGTFPLTKAVYKFNGASDSRLLNTLLFWLLLIVPVYDIALFGDGLVLNLIEFWTGAEFAGGSRAEVTAEDGTSLAFEPAPDGRTATLTARRDGKVQGELTFVKTSDTTFEVRDASGRLTGKVVRTPDGGLTLMNADGLLVSSVPAGELAAALAR